MPTARRLKLARVTATSDRMFDFDRANQHHHHAPNGPSGATGQDAQAPVAAERANDSAPVCTAESAMVRRSKFNNGETSKALTLASWTFLKPTMTSLKRIFSIHASRPVCPAWSSWKIDTPCSVTCGQGYSSKYRTCINGQIGEEGCQGNARSQEVCETGNECPVWAEWGEWSECGVTCGQSQVVRRRECFNGEPGDIGCEGEDAETKVCFGPNRECPSWSPWSNLSPCSVS